MQPILISDDTTLIAAASAKHSSAATNIYRNGSLATTVPGWGVATSKNLLIAVLMLRQLALNALATTYAQTVGAERAGVV